MLNFSNHLWYDSILMIMAALLSLLFCDMYMNHDNIGVPLSNRNDSSLPLIDE